MAVTQALAAPFDLYGVLAQRDQLRQRVGTPRFAAWWDRFLADAHAAAVPALPPPGQAEARHAAAAFGRAEETAFAAALTADAALGRKAAMLLLAALAEDAPWMGPAHHHHYPELNADLVLAERCKRVAAAASWAQAWLTEAERRQVRQGLCERGGAVIFSDACRGAWWANGYNSNWTAVLNSGLGLAALAVAPEYPAAASQWLTRAAEVARAMLDLAAEEGAGVEGIGYWVYCFSSLFDLADALGAAGVDTLLRHPCWRRAVEFPLYHMLPDLSGWLNFGDCGFPASVAAPFHGLASRLATVGRSGSPTGLAARPGCKVSWRDLVWCDPSVPEESKPTAGATLQNVTWPYCARTGRRAVKSSSGRLHTGLIATWT